jgi:hypothetical protein
MNLAPNGKPSNLNAEQYKLVRTQEFKAWFGDWENTPENASKIVDENGEPLVCYHGSRENFSVFEKKYIGSTNDMGFYGSGFYFTFQKLGENRNYAINEAAYYGSNITNSFIKAINPFDFSILSQYKGYDINYLGSESIVFLSNLAKMFPILGELIKINKNIYNSDKNEYDNERVPISILPELIEKYSKELVTYITDNNWGERIVKSGYVKNEIVEYIKSDGSKASYESFDSLGRIEFRIKDGIQYPSNEEIEILLICDAIKKYDGIDSDYHPEGYMTRYEEITDAIKQKHDCIMQNESGDELVVFESNQIKLADGSNTTFDMNNPDIRYSKGGRTIAQTPAPKSDRVKGSSKNKAGSAASKKSAASIVLSEEVIKALKAKADKYNEKHSNKVSVNTLKAVFRRGSGAYSTSHRPTITGGAPNSRNAWSYARVNKFLLKKGGTKVKAAYVQDDDLMEDGGEIGIDISEDEIKEWKESHKVNKKQVRNDKVKEAAKLLSEGKIPQQDYLKIVRDSQPIKPFKEVPKIPSLLEIVGSLKSNQIETGIIGYTKFIEDGEYVASRLDIPAYENYDVWVVSVHNGNKEGQSIGYGQTAYLENVNFLSSPKTALKIAIGESDKSTIGRMFGSWVNKDPKEVREMAIKYMNSPDWVQVGMNPFRHSWFYDKSDGMPLLSASKVIQVGALVLAKNAIKTTTDNPIFIADKNNPNIKFAGGGKTKGGDCYYIAGQFAMDNILTSKHIDYIGTPYLVHAEVKGQGKIKGIMYGHAWIEDDVNVYDFSNNREIIMPKDVYYAIGRIKTDNPKKYLRYTFEEARNKMLDTGNYGCWDLDVQYADGGIQKNYKEISQNNTYMKKGGELNPDNSSVKNYFAHDSGNAGGVLVGQRHSEGGIKAMNKGTGQPIEMEGGEVVITRNAVSDNSKREFDGQMLTNRQILSKINESGGGVSFADGGDVPESIMVSGREYSYGGKTMKDSDIVSSCGCKHSMAEGGETNSRQAYYATLSNKCYEDGGELDTEDFNDTEKYVLNNLKLSVHGLMKLDRTHAHKLENIENKGLIYITQSDSHGCKDVKLTDYGIEVVRSMGDMQFKDGGSLEMDCGCKEYKSGGTTDTDTKYYKGTKHNYKNQHLINKAIEELVTDIEPKNLTPEEIQFMSYYAGSGGLEKYGATGIGLKYEYFTPSEIAKKMWGLAYKHGFKGGRVLEPSCGIGEFIKYAPEQHLVTGYEINQFSAKICSILYPNATIESKYFETLFIKNNDTIKDKTKDLKKYSLVIGNPPYGTMEGKYAGMGEKSYTKSNNYIDYFISRGLDLLESNGILIYIIGAEVAFGGEPFLQKPNSPVKQNIALKADIVDAYRLPNGLFETTDVLTDIIVFKKK